MLSDTLKTESIADEEEMASPMPDEVPVLAPETEAQPEPPAAPSFSIEPQPGSETSETTQPSAEPPSEPAPTPVVSGEMQSEKEKARQMLFDPDLEPDQIIGAVFDDAETKMYYFAMKWKNPKESPVSLLTSKFANNHYPQTVIQFYQSRLRFEE